MKEELFSTVEFFPAAIRDSIASSHGLTAWFKAFIQSNEFAKLKPEHKGHAFETYVNLFNVLDQVDSLNIDQL